MSSDVADRQLYRSFWNKYSHRADNTSMLLNANADEMEKFDRAEIIRLLPKFEGNFVVDIGAGIGRFTSEFAQRAQKVVACDFMESFIVKNKERNAHFGNIEWRVGDAVGLQFDESSVDLLFTNWLLMYLSDEESVHFLANVLRWLRPGGHLHLRESCSEPSTRKTSGGTSLHSQTDANPTRYRFSSSYLQLLRSMRHFDGQKSWRFEIEWACSLAVYIEKNRNWRQIRWLVRKVPTNEQNGTLAGPKVCTGLEELVNKFAVEWPKNQRKLDEELDGRMEANRMLTEKLLCALDVELAGPVFIFNPRENPRQLGLDAHSVAKHFGCGVWSVEMDPFCYRHSLAIANREQDRRIRLAWHPRLQSALQFWALSRKPQKGDNSEDREEAEGMVVVPVFDTIIAVGLLDHLRDKDDVKRMASMLKNDGYLASLEMRSEKAEKIRLLHNYFTIEKYVDIEMETDEKHGIVTMKLLVARSTMKREPTLDWAHPVSAGF